MVYYLRIQSEANQIEVQLAEVEGQFAVAELAEADLATVVVGLRRVVAAFERSPPEEKRAIFQYILRRVKTGQGAALEVSLGPPPSRTIGPQTSHVWRSLSDSNRRCRVTRTGH